MFVECYFVCSGDTQAYKEDIISVIVDLWVTWGQSGETQVNEKKNIRNCCKIYKGMEGVSESTSEGEFREGIFKESILMLL